IIKSINYMSSFRKTFNYKRINSIRLVALWLGCSCPGGYTVLNSIHAMRMTFQQDEYQAIHKQRRKSEEHFEKY
ncbi:MAG: hypothetical protein M3Q58_02435, partial [Bacteroidota bacterium]|nr:hypothetical protein [Bacteroidota bacterium]